MTPAELEQIHAAAFDHPWSEAEFASLLAQQGVFAVEASGGFLLARQVADEAEILTLAVVPTERRKGRGRVLVEMAAAKAAALGAVRLFLEVAVDNDAAIALYDSCGFRQQGRRRGYYSRPRGGGVDALVLARDL